MKIDYVDPVFCLVAYVESARLDINRHRLQGLTFNANIADD
jgi:hypothetical protein